MKRWMVCGALCLAVALGTPSARAGEETAWTWRAGEQPKTRDKAGAYVWWNFGLRLLPGEYRLSGRLKGDGRAAFTLQVFDAIRDQSRWSRAITPGADMADRDFGVFAYDGTYPLRVSDWNQPGFEVEALTLTLVAPTPVPYPSGDAADALDGWIALKNTALALDSTEKKEGAASLKVTVDGDAKAKWHERGVMKRLVRDEVGMVSFWLRFDGAPRRFWVQLVHADGQLARPVDPGELGLAAGQWRFVELPVSSFHVKPPRERQGGVRAVAFSPDPGAEACVFRLDDILLE